MAMFRLIFTLMLFAVILVACETPFIAIDISSGQNGVSAKGPQAGCGWPISVCPGIAIRGSVDKVVSLGQQTIYSVKEEHSDTIWNIAVPPAQVVGDSRIDKDSFVQIGTDAATQTISVIPTIN